MKKIAFMVVALAAVAFASVSCSKGDEAGKDTADSTKDSTKAEQAAPAPAEQAPAAEAAPTTEAAPADSAK